MSSKPTEEEWHATLAKAYGDEKETAIIAALKKAYPEKKITTGLAEYSRGFQGCKGSLLAPGLPSAAAWAPDPK